MNCACCSENEPVSSRATELETLFNPQAIAVFGASTDSAKIGYRIVENILVGGYQGRVLPINPRGGEVLGLPMLRSIHEADCPVDVF